MTGTNDPEPDVHYRRVPDALHRVAHDRVLVHRVDATPETAAVDLSGPVALVWLALDEPADLDELARRLADAGIQAPSRDELADELDRLERSGLVERIAPKGDRGAPAPVDLGVVSAHLARVHVAAAEPLAEVLHQALADLRVEQTDTACAEHRLEVAHDVATGEWTVTLDGADRYTGPESHIALYDTLIALNQLAARSAVEAGRTVLHGGAVAIDGRAVAVVGHSGAGKSTLTTALVRTGHVFLADEVTAVDDDGTVHAFHRPIGLRRSGADHLGVGVPDDGPFDTVTPYVVGTRRGQSALGDRVPLRAVAVLRRDDRRSVPRIEAMTPARALFELSNQTLGATDLERAMFQRLDRLVRAVPVIELHYATTEQAIELLEDVVADRTLGAEL